MKPRLLAAVAVLVGSGFCVVAVEAGQPATDPGVTISPHVPAAGRPGSRPTGDPWLDTKLIGGFPATMPVVPTRAARPVPDSWWQQEVIGGFPPMLPVVPAMPPRPLDGPDGVKAFIKDVR